MKNKTLLSVLGTMVTLGLSGQLMGADSATVQKETINRLTQEMSSGFEKCYGIAKAGKNDCASGTTACAGQAATDGLKDAWVGVPKGTCARIIGGSLKKGA